MRKPILFLLVFALILPAALLTSCGNGGNGAETTAETKEAVTQEKDETAEALGFKKQNYQKEFKVLLNNSGGNDRDFMAEETDEDAVSRAVHARNLACEDYLGVSIEYTPEQGNWNSGMAQKLYDQIFAGACE